jgi:hypothetical protein
MLKAVIPFDRLSRLWFSLFSSMILFLRSGFNSEFSWFFSFLSMYYFPWENYTTIRRRCLWSKWLQSCSRLWYYTAIYTSFWLWNSSEERKHAIPTSTHGPMPFLFPSLYMSLRENRRVPTARLCADGQMSGPSAQRPPATGDGAHRRHSMAVGTTHGTPTATLGATAAVGTARWSPKVTVGTSGTVGTRSDRRAEPLTCHGAVSLVEKPPFSTGSKGPLVPVLEPVLKIRY